MLEAERIAKEADNKPLWEQLAGKREEKQAKFDAVRASMFGTYAVFFAVDTVPPPRSIGSAAFSGNIILLFSASFLRLHACWKTCAWRVVKRHQAAPRLSQISCGSAIEHMPTKPRGACILQGVLQPPLLLSPAACIISRRAAVRSAAPSPRRRGV